MSKILVIEDLDGTMTYNTEFGIDVGGGVTYRRLVFDKIKCTEVSLEEKFRTDMKTAKAVGKTPDGGQLAYFLSNLSPVKVKLEDFEGIGKEYNKYSRTGLKKVHRLWRESDIHSVVATAGPEQPAIEYAQLVGVYPNGFQHAFGTTFKIEDGVIIDVDKYCGADHKVNRLEDLLKDKKYEKFVVIGDSPTNDGPLMQKNYDINGENALNISMGERAKEYAHVVVKNKFDTPASYYSVGMIVMAFGNYSYPKMNVLEEEIVKGNLTYISSNKILDLCSY